MNFESKINFNSEWVAAQTLEAFIEHESHHGLSDKQLKEIHAACKKEVGKKKEDSK